MRIIDADKLKITIKEHEYLLINAINSHDYGMFTTGIYQAIDEQPELPTIKTNEICNYCEHPNEPLTIDNVETNICWQCGASHQWCMFKGKRMIEVSE